MPAKGPYGNSRFAGLARLQAAGVKLPHRIFDSSEGTLVAIPFSELKSEADRLHALIAVRAA